MDFKGLLKDRIVQVLLFVIVLNVVVFVLLWRLDVFVNGDLYDFGLTFSFDWAKDYWYYSGLLWGFLAGATILLVLSIIPHSQHSKQPSRITKWLGFLLPVLAVVYEGVSVWFLYQIDWVVQNTLLGYGLIYSVEWSSVYYSFSTPAFVLMVTVLVVLIVPAIRTLEIIEIEILQEELDIEIESTGSEDQKVGAGLNLMEIKGVGPKRALELERVGVKTVSDLATCSPKYLAEKTGLPITQISKWIIEANKQSK